MEEAKKHTPPTAAMLAALAIEKKRGPAKTELAEYLRARETGDQERVDRKDGGRGPINPTQISHGYSNSKPKDDTTQGTISKGERRRTGKAT